VIWITRGHVRGVALNVNFAIPGALRIDVVEFLSREPVHPLPPPEEVVKAPVLLHNNNNVINRMGYRQHRHHGNTYHHCPHRIYGLVCLLPELLFRLFFGFSLSKSFFFIHWDEMMHCNFGAFCSAIWGDCS
jgi:hypothetical protein